MVVLVSSTSKLLLVLLFHCTVLCGANTEKTIFLGPDYVNIPSLSPSFVDLNLHQLSPIKPSLRLELPRSFPNSSHSRGLQSWYVLNDLTPGQRYEVRICWLATEPTEFWLETYEINKVFETPSLIASLSSFAESQTPSQQTSDPFAGEKSSLFLQIHAAADYFTLNRTLMKEPPPVLADIILDPYIWNVFPRSLGPTAIYIICIAFAGWFISGWIWQLLRDIASDEKSHND